MSDRRADVIHRDLSSSNIFLARSREHNGVCPKILDFGVSKHLGASDRKVDRLLAHYEQSHRHPTNELIHFVAIPAIMVSLVGLIFAILLILVIAHHFQGNPAAEARRQHHAAAA